jgi:hypothetical protein
MTNQDNQIYVYEGEQGAVHAGPLNDLDSGLANKEFDRMTDNMNKEKGQDVGHVALADEVYAEPVETRSYTEKDESGNSKRPVASGHPAKPSKFKK